MLQGICVLKICSKFTGENPCRSVISTKLLCNFIEITLRHGCSPLTLLHIFRTPFSKNTTGWLLLIIVGNEPATLLNKKTKNHNVPGLLEPYLFPCFSSTTKTLGKLKWYTKRRNYDIFKLTL